MGEASPRPWTQAKGTGWIYDQRQEVVAICGSEKEEDPIQIYNAALIVRSVNAAEELIDACKAALFHVQELRDAWQTGSLSDHDGKGGERSNRNVDVALQLTKALAKGEAPDATH